MVSVACRRASFELEVLSVAEGASLHVHAKAGQTLAQLLSGTVRAARLCRAEHQHSWATWPTCSLLVRPPRAAARHSHLLQSAVVARLRRPGGQHVLYDLTRPLTGEESQVELLAYADPAGRDTFWHSAAHVLGAALEGLYGDRVRLCDGPPM